MLRLFVSLFVIFSCIYGYAECLGSLPKLDGRIIGGQNATIEKYPYQVSLQTRQEKHFCGGSIISELYIVTAGHCVKSKSANDILVRLGSSFHSTGGQLVYVKSLKYHKNYNSNTVEYDVGIVQLARPVSESSTVRYIQLANFTPYTGKAAAVSGWGVTTEGGNVLSDILQEVIVYIIGRKQCKSPKYEYGDDIRKTMLCAAALNKDACQGDSGGPLVVNNELVGIVSWGYGCAQVGYPGVYSNIAVLKKWIIEQTRKLENQ